VALLENVVDSVCYQPMIEIEPGPDLTRLPALMAQQDVDILIFVSGFAVDYFITGLKTVEHGEKIKQTAMVAVGASTAKKLHQWTSQTVISAVPETTEGLLALAPLQAEQVNGKNIVIVRGLGGRELLAEQLQSRGAKTVYWQLYQRLGITGKGQQWLPQWQSNNIDSIVITSIAIFDSLLENLTGKKAGNLAAVAMPWLCQLKWVVASDRIAQHIGQSGIPSGQIFNANGASDQAVFEQVKRIIEN
jgi:uroporphyrinogen-III synthase